MVENVRSELEENYPYDEKPNEKSMAENYEIAKNTKRGRTCINMHEAGDKLNRSFNFLTKNTFMKPHSHNEKGMVEEIRIIEGKVRVYFFDESGNVMSTVELAEKGDYIHVPTNVIHTYVVLTNEAMTYETMTGIYEKNSWKTFPAWSKILSEELNKGKMNSKNLRFKKVDEKAY